jgi:hypothetical protein
LAQHLVSVLCAFEAQVPENVVHKMQHLLVEKKKSREFLPRTWKRLHHGTQGMANTKSGITYTLTPAFKSSSTSAALVGCQIGIPKIEAR